MYLKTRRSSASFEHRLQWSYKNLKPDSDSVGAGKILSDPMPTKMLRTIVIVAACFCGAALAVAGERPRHASPNAVRNLAADRDPYADPAAPYKADRLSWSRQPILNLPGQTTVLTREILDDTNATSLSKALGSAAGVTVGR
jgi:outer membrane receptor for monomeric catechols